MYWAETYHLLRRSATASLPWFQDALGREMGGQVGLIFDCEIILTQRPLFSAAQHVQKYQGLNMLLYTPYP